MHGSAPSCGRASRVWELLLHHKPPQAQRLTVPNFVHYSSHSCELCGSGDPGWGASFLCRRLWALLGWLMGHGLEDTLRSPLASVPPAGRPACSWQWQPPGQQVETQKHIFKAGKYGCDSCPLGQDKSKASMHMERHRPERPRGMKVGDSECRGPSVPHPTAEEACIQPTQILHTSILTGFTLK